MVDQTVIQGYAWWMAALQTYPRRKVHMHASMYVERLPALINLAMQLRIVNLLLCIRICACCLLKVNITLLPPLILHLAIELSL